MCGGRTDLSIRRPAGSSPMPAFSRWWATTRRISSRRQISSSSANAVPRTNPEALATEELGLPRLSMPEALDRFVLRQRRPFVVAGSHGKTTTTAMAAWVYSEAGADPGFLIGGVPIGLPSGFALGKGARFVIEGDEYNASYFDRGPKFWHYRPDMLIVTSLEHDHVDLYPDFESLERAFAGLVERLPPTGLLVACADYPTVERPVAREPLPGGHVRRPGRRCPARRSRREQPAGDLFRAGRGRWPAADRTERLGQAQRTERDGGMGRGSHRRTRRGRRPGRALHFPGRQASAGGDRRRGRNYRCR